jgi:hypothetical protein
MYAATCFGCAVYESVFHDIDPAATFKTVPLSQVEELAGSRIEIDLNLNLVRLFEPDLNKWGMIRQSLIDTPPSFYPSTRAWAQAIQRRRSNARRHDLDIAALRRRKMSDPVRDPRRHVLDRRPEFGRCCEYSEPAQPLGRTRPALGYRADPVMAQLEAGGFRRAANREGLLASSDFSSRSRLCKSFRCPG